MITSATSIAPCTTGNSVAFSTAAPNLHGVAVLHAVEVAHCICSLIRFLTDCNAPYRAFAFDISTPTSFLTNFSVRVFNAPLTSSSWSTLNHAFSTPF